MIYSTDGTATVQSVHRKASANFVHFPDDLELSQFFPNGALSVRVRGSQGSNGFKGSIFRFYIDNHNTPIPSNTYFKKQAGLNWRGNIVIAKYRWGEAENDFANITSQEVPYIDSVVLASVVHRPSTTYSDYIYQMDRRTARSRDI